MDVFVQSSGISKDYCWLNAKNNSNKSIDLPNIVSNLTNIIDTEFPCLILDRDHDKAILCITALKSSRTDNRTRTICNSVIWIGDQNDEKKLQSLVIDYLKNTQEFSNEIDKAITFEPENGFKVDMNKIPLGDESKLSNLRPLQDDKSKIGNFEKLKSELLRELKQYQLPKKDSILIFISTIKSQDFLENKVKAWRGLSSQIKGDGWINLSSQNNIIQVSESNNDNIVSVGKNKFIVVLLTLLLTFSMILNGFLFLRVQELEKRFNQIEKLKSTINDSERNIQQAQADYEKNIQDAQKTFFDDLTKAQSNYNNNINKVRKMLDDAINKVNQM